MTSHLARLGLGVLAALTLFLSAGGALGLWQIGAPATRPGVTTAAAASGAPGDGSLRPAAARWSARDAEGPNGDVPSSTPDAAAPDKPAVQPTAPQTSSAAPSSTPTPAAAPQRARTADVALPPHSGTGRRVVFDMSDQQVWIVGSAGEVLRTYPVSGSKHDNLDPGNYEVYSRSRHAISYDYQETMQYMVRFASGDNAAIGFHDIPVDDGHLVQTKAQLGTPRSHGCIRQERTDAIALWKFAPLGTTVVVTA